jgi:hypothetical protein
MTRHIHPEKIAEVYDEQYDAYYNPQTNEWVESKCDDPTCEYCVNRPERPLLELDQKAFREVLESLKKFDWEAAVKKINKPQ